MRKGIDIVSSTFCPRKSAGVFNRQGVLFLLVLAAATILIYAQIRHFEFINYDDTDYVTENINIHTGLNVEGIVWAFTTVHAGNWHPLTWLSHMLDVSLFGMDPGGHHVMNLIFHVLNTLLVFVVFSKMTGAMRQSAFVAAMFALHPLHVESVAWVSERKDLLSTFFWMLALMSYTWYAAAPSIRRYLVVGVFFCLGLMSKPMVITLPFVLLLLDYWPLKRCQWSHFKGGANGGRALIFGLLREKIPLLAISVLSAAVTVYAQASGGAVKDLDIFPPAVRVANAVVAYASYIIKMIWPSDLAFLYPHPGMPPGWQMAGALLLLVVITVFAVVRAEKQPYVIFGWLWFIGTLVPVIGLVQVGMQAMADRYTYIPLIGLFVMLTWGLADAARKWRLPISVLALAAGVLLLVSGTLTWKQTGYWKNSETLFRHALDVTRENFIAHYNLANVLARQKDQAEAVFHYRQALQVKPGFSDAHINLGNTLSLQGNDEDAIRHYRAALKLQPQNARLYVNLAIALEKTGLPDQALTHYLEAIQIDPDNEDTRYRAANILFQSGKASEAAAQYREAVRVAPDFAEAHYNLGVVLFQQADISGAIDAFERALSVRPDFDMARLRLRQAIKALKYQSQQDVRSD
jgi:protein O-mannosyl-transferase